MKTENKIKIHAKDHNSYKTFTILGLILPFVGIIVGIVYLTKSDVLERKLGEHTIVMSILGFVLGSILWATLFSSAVTNISTSPSVTIPNQTTTPSSSPTLNPAPTVGKVEVKSHQLKTVYGTKQIVGEVVNNTGGNVSFVKVTATYYDKAGAVTGTDFTYAGDTASTPLVAGATSPFTVSSMETGIVIDHYKLDVTWN